MKLADSLRNLLGTPSATKPPAGTPSCCHEGGACERPSRAGERPSAPPAPAGDAPPSAQRLDVTVERGYRPARLAARAGTPVRITFLRNETSACSKEVVFPGLGIRRELPTGTPVSVDLPALSPGLVPFTCGMGMLKGGIEVR